MSGIEALGGFCVLPADVRQQVAAATREQKVARGVVLFTEGQPAQVVWAVKQGLVHIVKTGASGREVVIEIIGEGELFGAVAAIQERTYPASAIAVEESVVWRLPASFARQLCSRYPELRASILEVVANRLRGAHDRLRSLALEPVEQRLARTLLALAEKIGREKDGVLMLSVTRQELADMVGTTVETTIRITSRWQRQGIVRSVRHELDLLDRPALATIADPTP